MSTRTKDARPAPRLCTDYCGEVYIVVDNDGDPVSDYYTDVDTARFLRDRQYPGFRIYRVSYRIIDENPVLHDDGRPE